MPLLPFYFLLFTVSLLLMSNSGRPQNEGGTSYVKREKGVSALSGLVFYLGKKKREREKDEWKHRAPQCLPSDVCLRKSPSRFLPPELFPPRVAAAAASTIIWYYDSLSLSLFYLSSQSNPLRKGTSEDYIAGALVWLVVIQVIPLHTKYKINNSSRSRSSSQCPYNLYSKMNDRI